MFEAMSDLELRVASNSWDEGKVGENIFALGLTIIYG